MRESVRRTLNLIAKVEQIEGWVMNILFLLLVLIVLAYVFYRGWLSLHLR